MAFVHPALGEAGFLELSVHVACENENATRHAVRPPVQNREALARSSLAVKLQAVSVEAPCKFRMLRKTRRVCHVFEREALLTKRRISAPETISASKIRKARIDAHSSTRGDEQSVCFSQPVAFSSFSSRKSVICVSVFVQEGVARYKVDGAGGASNAASPREFNRCYARRYHSSGP